MRTIVSLSTAIALTLACSQEAASPWACAPESVPGGEAQSCTTSATALTSDGPAVDGTSEFDCIGASDPRCPPVSTVPTGGTSDGPIDCQFTPDLPYCQGSTSSSSGGSSGSTSDGNGSSSGGSSSGGSSSGLVSSSSGGTQDGNGSSGNNNGSSGNNNSSSGNNNGSSGNNNSSSGSNNGSSGNNNSSSGSNAGSSGTTDGASSSGGSAPPPKGSWHCIDKDGERTCRSNVPKCVDGYHPAACGACVPNGGSDDDCVSPSEGGCWITGGGFIEADSVVPNAPADGNDNFGGNAKAMKRGGLQGHWNHVDHGTGRHLDGDIQYLVCRHANEPGPSNPGGKKGFDINVAYFGGPARFQVGGTWEDGYWYDVEARDHGEPGSSNAATKKGAMADTYNVTIRKQVDVGAGASGVIVYQTGASLSGGNIQIHPPNQGHPASTSSAPVWVTVIP